VSSRPPTLRCAESGPTEACTRKRADRLDTGADWRVLALTQANHRSRVCLAPCGGGAERRNLFPRAPLLERRHYLFLSGWRRTQ